MSFTIIGGNIPASADPFQGEVPGGAPFLPPTFGPSPTTSDTPTGVLQSGGDGSSSSPSPSLITALPSSSSSSTSSFSSSSSSASSPTSTTGSSSTSSSAASGTKTSPSSTTLSSSVPTLATQSTSHNKNAIIGGVVGGVVGLLIIAALVMYYRIRRSRRDPRVTAFKVPSDKIAEPTHPPVSKPDISTTHLPSVSSSNLAYSVPSDAQQKIDEPPVIAMPQRDPLIDQSMSHPNRSSPELIRTTLPIVSHNPRDLNPLLREILNVTQGRNLNQDPLDPGDPNVPQNIQIFIINQPSNRDGSAANENEENRGVHYGRSPPRNMDIDTLSLPPSYE